MKLINDNLKQTGLFNTLLIILAIVLRIINIGKMEGFAIVDTIVCIVGLLSGLVYSLYGYKKNVSMFYKIFMLLFFVDSVIYFIAILYLFGFDSNSDINLFHGMHIVIIICSFLLTFVNNFGEHNSKTAVSIILAFNAVKLFNDITTGRLAVVNYASLDVFVQTIIAYVLVSHKYIDKESRSTL